MKKQKQKIKYLQLTVLYTENNAEKKKILTPLMLNMV